MIEAVMHDFWLECGFDLLTRDALGRLCPNDEFLRSYLHRPQMQPVAESCSAERLLHARLVDAPQLTVEHEQVRAIADRDTRENYEAWLAFRDVLLCQPTIEAAYVAIFVSPPVTIAPVFIDHLVQLIARNMLDGCEDALLARTAELLFRRQSISIVDGAILAADAEFVESYSEGHRFGDLGRLIASAQNQLRSVELDVLRASSEAVWQRIDRHDTAVELSYRSNGQIAFVRVLELWLKHLLGVEARIEPLREVRDERWVWHLGLDAHASALLDDLYSGQPVDPHRLEQLLGLFSLQFRDPSVVRAPLRERPVYLGLCMDERRSLRVKPQNLLVNLPLATQA